MSKKKCVGCGKDAEWRTKRKGFYPHLCDKCLNELPNLSENIEYYTYIGGK